MLCKINFVQPARPCNLAARFGASPDGLHLRSVRTDQVAANNIAHVLRDEPSLCCAVSATPLGSFLAHRRDQHHVGYPRKRPRLQFYKMLRYFTPTGLALENELWGFRESYLLSWVASLQRPSPLDLK